MKINVNAIKNLLRVKRTTIDAVRKLVEDGSITAAQYTEITGKEYK